MRGKFAFVLGAALGYVLGTRAGRERYEQIKRGAETLWNAPPVQSGKAAVQDALGGQIDRVKDAAVRAGKDAFTTFTKGVSGAAGSRGGSSGSGSSNGRSSSGSGASSGSSAGGNSAPGGSQKSSSSSSSKSTTRASAPKNGSSAKKSSASGSASGSSTAKKPKKGGES